MNMAGSDAVIDKCVKNGRVLGFETACNGFLGCFSMPFDPSFASLGLVRGVIRDLTFDLRTFALLLEWAITRNGGIRYLTVLLGRRSSAVPMSIGLKIAGPVAHVLD